MKPIRISIAILFTLLLAAFSPPARADGLMLNLSDHWACSPVGAITGYQLNLKTTTFQKGVALGVGYGCRYDGWKVPLGIDLVGGISINDNAPNAGQGNILFVVDDNFGLAIGGQVHRDPTDGSLVPQALLSFVLTASTAATIEQFSTAKKTAAARAAAAPVATPPNPVAVEGDARYRDVRGVEDVTTGIILIGRVHEATDSAEPFTYPNVATKSGGLQVSGGDAR